MTELTSKCLDTSFLILAQLFSDYREMPELDRYEEAGLDNADYEVMAVDQRRAAERDLDREGRIREHGKHRGPAAFADDEDFSDDENYARRG